MQCVRYQQKFVLLIAIAVPFLICSIGKSAIAISTNNHKGCIDDRELQKGWR
ncbi:MAG: hypothetical protein KME21_29810 [Desmonostoc vinosum HA7617-LM4]|nr:hypothetical protein [Desmonostoc vinosum HA7617-LM4]